MAISTTSELPASSYSPKEFLRNRRPEQFSDTVVSARSQLDRSILEYHLESLTNRSQEIDFEAFCRRLAEHEICPNLVPHTGPTGGGDSKVDSETYPVADADNWYAGVGREAANERWAFAISAKKEWRPKVQSDVAKIVGTDRGYLRIFFLSSRYIRDKERAEVEDALTAKYGVSVRIFDRTWLLDKVFQNKHEALAIETLRLQVPAIDEQRPGPQDAQRLLDFEELQAQVREATSQQRYSMALVDECLEMAILARQLERPADETNALFGRAARLAAKYGTQQQRFTCSYQHAWTAYWWHEDLLLFEELYAKVEAAAAGSSNAFDLERSHNLWTLYQTGVRHNLIEATPAQVADKATALRAELNRLSLEVSRPSAALQARAQLLQLDLTQLLVAGNRAGVENLFLDMQQVVRESRGLIGFPLDSLAEAVTSIGELFVDVPAYDDLFAQLVEASALRKSEVVAANLLVQRGVQQCDGGRPTEAIKSFGKALGRLYKHESRREMVKALTLNGIAYTGVGLYWAARNSTLFSASIATDEYWRYGEVTAAQLTCFKRLAWLELQLGRISFALGWYELYLTFAQTLVAKGYDADKVQQECEKFDQVLGLLLLKTKVEDLLSLISLPALLDELHLFNASLAALFALGHEAEIVRQEPFNQQPERLLEFFQKWLELRVEGYLPAVPVFYEGPIVQLRSIVMGCQIEMRVENELALVLLAESLLAGFESFLSTSIGTDLILKEPVLTVEVVRDPAELTLFAFEVTEPEGRPHLLIRCGTLQALLSSAQAQHELKEHIGQMLLAMLACVVMHSNIEPQMKTLFEDEQAATRAVDFNNSFLAFTNVLGDTPKYRLADWPVPATTYAVQRTQAWYESLPPQSAAPAEVPPAPAAAKHSVAHNQVEISSLIRDGLWNRAGWVGVGFAQFAEPACPAMCLLFSDREAAIKIFELWRKELTADDATDRLRITLVRRFDKKKPLAYRALIGSNQPIPASGKSGQPVNFSSYRVTAHRMHVMDNPAMDNVEPFKQQFAKYKTYLLVPGIFNGPTAQPTLFPQLGIFKHQIHIREAWEIGINELDSMGIDLADDPVVPPGVTEPPFQAIQQAMRLHSAPTI
jgi:hypothetical protein